MPIICQFDQTVHADLEALHSHIRRFKISRKNYYWEFFPRRDPITNDLIPFDNYEQYFNQDFANKNTLKAYLKQQPEAGWKWSKEWLAKRKVAKNLIYAPSQVELRTCMCPSMPYYDKVGAAEGGYYGVTGALGFGERYNNSPLLFTPLARDTVILQDTREQSPLTLSHSTREETVNVGDYALAAPYDLGIRIERKGLSDFCGTLSGRKQTRKNKNSETEWSNLERFDRELARAQEAGLYVVMMVENNITDAQRFDYFPQTQWIKASPSYIFHNLRNLLVKYPLTFQCVFCDGRDEMAKKIVRVFELGSQVKTTDLQNALERGLL